MLEVKNLYCGYDGFDVVKNISFTLREGSALCVAGPNGCGKSTMLKAINNLIDYKGQVLIDGKEAKKMHCREMAKNIALMSQVSNIYFPYTVYEAVSLGRYAHLTGAFSTLKKSDEEIVDDAIENVGLSDFKDKLITELSGGQLQRVYLARAFVQDPKVLLLDEPTNHLDLKCQIEILEYIMKWKKDKGRSVIAVLHDLNLVQMFSDEVLLMNDGCAAALGKPKEVFKDDVLSSVFGLDIRSFMVTALSNWTC